MAYCAGCKRTNCTMTNNGDCPFYTSIDYGDTIYDGRNRRQRRADELERILKSSGYNELERLKLRNLVKGEIFEI